MLRAVFAAVLATGVAAAARGAGQEATPQQIFEKRLLPIFKSPDPSSCAQCHLAGVDLKNYILPSHEKTFVSLRDQGLIDLEKPESSKILRLIQMGEEEKKGAALISDKVRKLEYEAFAEWIRASAADPKLRAAPKLAAAELAKPKRPDEVIRHARADRVLESFERNVWSQRFRCSGCHSPDGAENRKLVKENGEEMTWIRREGAEATMKYLLASKDIDPKAPEKSLLLTKPTNQVKHGGGQKMIVGDLAYKGFRTWLEDYAKTVGDRYAKASDLPKEAASVEQVGTDLWLKIENTPAAWGDKLLQATVYAWDEKKKGWETEPAAATDRLVWGKGKLWQHNLSLLGRSSLPAGKYLVKVHVDLAGRLARDWKAAMGRAEFAGQAEIQTSWPSGYGSMTVIDAARIRP